MRALLLIAFAFTLSGLAAPVAAQGESRIPQGKHVDNLQDSRRIVAIFAQCTVRRHQADASRIILEQIDNSGVIKSFQSVIDGDCMPDRNGDGVMIKLPGPILRNALADALVSSMGVPPLVDLGLVAPLDHRGINEADYLAKPGKTFKPSEAAEMAESRQKDIASIGLSVFGECAVRQSPAQARALLLTSVGTPEEEQAFAGLKPAFGGCIVSGQRFTFTREILRGAVALNYYRLARAPRVAVANGAPK